MSRWPASRTKFKATELSTPPDKSTAIFTFGCSRPRGDEPPRRRSTCQAAKETSETVTSSLRLPDPAACLSGQSGKPVNPLSKAHDQLLSHMGQKLVVALMGWSRALQTLNTEAQRARRYTARRSRNGSECARPRAQQRREPGGVRAIPSVQPCVACCGRDGRTPKISSQLGNNFDDRSAESRLQ